MQKAKQPTPLDLKLARVSARCPLCNWARRRQRGLLFAVVRAVEGKLCPFCRAYARVFGRPSHAPVSQREMAGPD